MEKPKSNENIKDLNTDQVIGKNPFGFFSMDTKFNLTQDLNAPILYSRQAIYYFTCFCSVFFGGTLLFINLRKLKNKKGQLVVAVYSIVYGVTQIAILSQFERNIVLTMLVSMVGSFPLCNTLWERYVGRSTSYKPKSILRPLISAIVIFGLIIACYVILVSATQMLE